MKSIFRKLIVLSILTLISCNNEEIVVEPETNGNLYDETTLGNIAKGRLASSNCHFEYSGESGPENWASLCGEDWKDCNGKEQSPINIVTNDVVTANLFDVSFGYNSSTVDIINNGHTVQFNYNAGSYITMNEIKYNLLQFHFHTGSEHIVDGYRYDMEMHLVHQDPVTKNLIVVGVFFTEGEENNILTQYVNNLPTYKGGHYIDSSTFAVADMLPNNKEHYTYYGSLTTPGCSEIVTWYVFKEPITASHEQLDVFRSIMHHNYRPVQKLNSRQVYSN